MSQNGFIFPKQGWKLKNILGNHQAVFGTTKDKDYPIIYDGFNTSQVVSRISSINGNAPNMRKARHVASETSLTCTMTKRATRFLGEHLHPSGWSEHHWKHQRKCKENGNPMKSQASLSFWAVDEFTHDFFLINSASSTFSKIMIFHPKKITIASFSMAVSKGLRCPTYFSPVKMWLSLQRKYVVFNLFYPQNRRFFFCPCVFSLHLVTGSQNKGGYRLGPSKPAQAQHGFRHNTTDLGGNFSQNQLPWVESNHLCRGFPLMKPWLHQPNLGEPWMLMVDAHNPWASISIAYRCELMTSKSSEDMYAQSKNEASTCIKTLNLSFIATTNICHLHPL